MTQKSLPEDSRLYLTTRKEWRSWLQKHFKTETVVWLAYFKKETGKPRIQYNEAVEEALCFGWIDSTVRKVNDECFAQRFSKRNPKSKYSQANKVRLRSLARRKKIHKEVLQSLSAILEEKYAFPKDILLSIKTNKTAWKNFQKFSPQYKEIRIAFIDGARKRPEEFTKRLRYFVKMTEGNKTIGFGGIEKHY
jgi:uncharacterized protein YdeI (YjbR/CyaY-like superfamily)